MHECLCGSRHDLESRITNVLKLGDVNVSLSPSNVTAAAVANATLNPTSSPTFAPTSDPTLAPTNDPTFAPSSAPTTSAPTTGAPTTSVPTTGVPTTSAPITVAPTSAPTTFNFTESNAEKRKAAALRDAMENATKAAAASNGAIRDDDAKIQELKDDMAQEELHSELRSEGQKLKNATIVKAETAKTIEEDDAKIEELKEIMEQEGLHSKIRKEGQVLKNVTITKAETAKAIADDDKRIQRLKQDLAREENATARLAVSLDPVDPTKANGTENKAAEKLLHDTEAKESGQGRDTGAVNDDDIDEDFVPHSTSTDSDSNSTADATAALKEKADELVGQVKEAQKEVDSIRADLISAQAEAEVSNSTRCSPLHAGRA